MTGTISAVIPVRDGQRWLGEAIESVLSQEGPRHEVLVVDDGSTDGTADVMRSFGTRIRPFHQAPLGAAAARNLGVLAATGSVLSFLDADDVWEAGKSALQLAALEERVSREGSRVLVFAHARSFTSEGGEGPPGPAREAICAGTLLAYRRTFLEVGLFDPGRQVGEFLEWYARAVDLGVRPVVLPEPLLRRRLHDSNSGVVRQDQYASSYLRILHAARVRRRDRGR